MTDATANMTNTATPPPPKRHIRTTIYWSWVLVAGLYSVFGLLPLLAEGSLTPESVFFTAVAAAAPLLAALAGLRLRSDKLKYMPFLFRVAMPLYVPAVLALYLGARLTPALCFFLAIFWGAAACSAARLFSLFRESSRLGLAAASLQAWCAGWVVMQFLIWFLPIIFYMPLGVFYLSFLMLTNPHGLTLIAVLITLFILYCVSIPARRKRIAALSVALLGLAFFLLTGPDEYFFKAALLFLPAWFGPICLVWFFKSYIIDSLSGLYISSGGIFTRKTARLAFCLSALVAISLAYTAGTGDYRSASVGKLTLHALPQAQKREVARNLDKYRETLAEMYLAPYFYPFTDLSFERISILWDDAAAWALRPVMYPGGPGEMRKDQQLAANVYQELFGLPIEAGERERIARITRSPQLLSSLAFADVQSDRQRVYLASQELQLRESGEWADLELHEEYRNTGSNVSEKATLFFRLPPGAVITDLWISDDNMKKFQAVVAPKGAAQKTFNQIVRRGQDPALVEQIGPDIYKLQLFPVVPDKNGEAFHVWLRLRCLKQDDDVWPLPVLEKSENVRRDAETAFLLNGGLLPDRMSFGPENWLPAYIHVVEPSAPTRQLASAGKRVLRMEPRMNYAIPSYRGLAVYLDTSLFMQDKKDELLRAAETIRQAWGGSVSFHIWEDGWQTVAQPLEERLGAHFFWGGLALDDLPAQPPSEAKRDAVPILLTSAERLADPRMAERREPFAKGAWICPVDPLKGRGAAQAVLQKLAEADGGLARNIPEMLEAIAGNQLRWDTPGVVHVDRRYVWVDWLDLPKNEPAPETGLPEAVQKEPLAVHTVVSLAGKNGPLSIESLDELQRLAMGGHVVTPYSSMIALVDDWQRTQLARAEKEKDRFDRRDEETTQPGDLPQRMAGGVPSLPGLGVTAVPEPEEWALIIVATCILLREAIRRRRRRGGIIFST